MTRHHMHNDHVRKALATLAALLGLLLLGLLLLVPSASGQEGHPLVGTWHGTHGPNATDRSDVTLVIFWDGKQITGLVNPGLRSMNIENASLVAEGWKVHLEAQPKDASEGRIAIDAVFEDITNVNRMLTGTWTQGAAKHDFRLRRDN